MSREDVIAVASRLFAAYLTIVVMANSVSAFQGRGHPSLDGWFVVSQLVLAACTLSIAALLWFFPVSVARSLLPVMKQPQTSLSPTGKTTLELAIAVLGLWLLAKVASDVVYWVTMLTLFSRSPVPIELIPEHYAAMVATALELGISAVFLLGHAGVARWILQLRYGSLAKAQPQPDAP